jgi:putative nucleotidyltransferase with HDIG domain
MAGARSAGASVTGARRLAAGFDSYRTPEAEGLLRMGAARFAAAGGAGRRLLSVDALAALLFLGLAGALAALAGSPRALSPSRLAILAAAFLVASRVRFPVGSGWTRPTQIVFVPMLFLLPAGYVPLVVGACLVADLWPQALGGRLTARLLATRLADSSYALGPAAVLVAFHQQQLSWRGWPVLVLALGAQFALDVCSGVARSWFAERIRPAVQLPMAWVYLTDACLSCVGLLVAAAARDRAGVVLLALPLVALFGLFARERQQRLDSMLELSSAYRGTAMLLGDVIEADDEYTGIHSRQVVDLSVAVARRLGLDAERLRNVELAALLHDVGKIRIPPEVIRKPGPLVGEELELIRSHTVLGEQMLRQVGGTLARIGAIVRSSHEHFDGSGYPDRLAGERIPLEARIIAVCDAYNAMVTDRPYRSAIPAGVARAELRRCAGSHFDPAVVAALESELDALAHAGAPSAELIGGALPTQTSSSSL